MTPLERARADEAKIAAEIVRLKSHLASLEIRRAKIQAYIELADFYEADEGSNDAGRQRGGVSGAAVRAAVEAIRDRGQPIHTRELIEILEKQRIQINGTNPIANLSGFLSRSDELRNSRATGWALAEWPSEPETKQQPEQASAGMTPAKGARQEPPTPSWDAPSRISDLDEEIPF